LRSLQEFVAVGGFTQRLGGDGAHVRLRHAGQGASKLSKAVQTALNTGFAQTAVFVKICAQAHHAFVVGRAAVAAPLHLAQFQTKAVGADVDARKNGAFGGG
jgi:hypothetical protein